MKKCGWCRELCEGNNLDGFCSLSCKVACTTFLDSIVDDVQSESIPPSTDTEYWQEQQFI